MRKAMFLALVLFSMLLCSCGYSEEEMESAKKEAYNQGYGDGYASGREDGYKEGYRKGYAALKPVAMPSSGEILSGSETKWQSEITINASYGSNHVVSVKTQDGTECVTFFVRSGETVTVGVPAKKLYVYFASGKEWYGYGKGLMFGDETSYTKDDDLIDFANYTISYTLSYVSNGNFEESPSSEREFF